MKDFTSLFLRLDETNKTSLKLAALKDYFRQAQPSDAAWAVAYLTGRRPKLPINAGQIRFWATAAANIPEWLFKESYAAVGDLAETVSLLLPTQERGSSLTLTEWIEQRLLSLAGQEEDEKREAIVGWWNELDQSSRFVFTKLLTGAWRVGVSQRLVAQALAEVLGVDSDVIAHRLMGTWVPCGDFYNTLSCSDTSDADHSKPYPFYLAYPFDGDTGQLGSFDEWQVEWKWDGIRAQVIKRKEQVFIWSRGEELVTDRFPEMCSCRCTFA